MRLTVEEEYVQKASPVSSLRAILEGYPLSAGIFRELLQNSDDGGASKQIFVLDQRSHAIEGLYSDGLAITQGPAFMAYNDAVLSTEDWQALSSMHDSSKTEDESKIGKYGVGFRSVFNLTDSPQILSDHYLAIFDPLRLYLRSEGKKIDLGHVASVFPNQLLPFDQFMTSGPIPPFRGTVIRCPLRQKRSKISDQVVRGEVISKLFKEFVDQELNISCLFLNNINCIEIHEIAPTGVTSVLAKMIISRSEPINSTTTATIHVNTNRVTTTKEWHIVQSNFSRDEVVRLLIQQPGSNPSIMDNVLQTTKISPEVKIAVDITSATRGRLFSFLPLPIFTGFPVHVHALFGIDSSRANLRRDSVGLASGSRDHTKVQWNTMLFRTLIPRTWGCLVEEMVTKELVSDVFSICPPESCAGELESFYSSLPDEFVGTLLATKAAVWPVYELWNQSTQFRSLESLVVISPTEPQNVLRALAGVGVSLTRPPSYIFNILRKSSESRILNPEVAHALLLENADKITEASDEDQKLLLEYLLSTNNVLNVCDLPLIPITNGKKVRITNRQGDSSYTMLTRSEFDVFGACDDSAIPLHQLQPQVQDTLLRLGPSTINVQKLAIPRIVEYLSIYPNRLGLYYSESKMNVSAVRWLSKFWEWMNKYEQRDELFAQIRNLFLLPSTNGLRRADSELFKLRGEHPARTMGYVALGLPFLASDFSEAAHAALQHFHLVKLIWDIPAVLDSLSSIRLNETPQPECENILRHLELGLSDSIGEKRIRGLRNLPIFPVLTYSTTGNSSGVTTSWTAIPQGHTIRSLGRPNFVPSINGVSFIGLNNIAPGIVKFLEPSHPSFISENDLVELAIENFTTQPSNLQLTLLRHITQYQHRTFPAIIAKLRTQLFVIAEDGRYHVPGDIVDPDSDIDSLYIGCPEYRPSTLDYLWLQGSQCLRSLNLLRAHLTPEIISERIKYISSRHTSDNAFLISRNMLLLLGSSNLDFSLVQGISEKKWLPTNKGICSADECRYAGVVPLALFDKVLAVLLVLEPFNMPLSLRTAIGWDKPLPIKLLIEQLISVLNATSSYDAVYEIVKEFGRRKWNDEDLDSLEKAIRDRQWIPTTDGILADIKSSVFKPPTMINSGFCQIRADLKAESVLRRIGCTDRPSTKAILDKLHSLDQDPNQVDLVGTSISLLRSLPDTITRMERSKLLVPDHESRLRPFAKVYYNDIGENHRLVNSEGHFIAHQSVDELLARKLSMERLGLRFEDLRNLGPNMGQSPITTVRHTLQQYTNQQFLLEFLANAEDAKATEFKMAINLMTIRDEQDLHVLSSAMAYLCKLPSLVVYNNAQFSSQDFEGICRTSVGGKEGRPDTIGEFGQGVLTMYHLTDLAMIISGSHVLFMDPAKKHLPILDLASLILPLQRVQQFYKDHLITLDGLFGFSMTSRSYNGTLFVLPLRACDGLSHPSHEFIIPDFWSPERLTSEILEPFKVLASDCLLFTSIGTINCLTRSEQRTVLDWSFGARKSQIAISETEYVVTDVEITKPTKSLAHWKTVTTLPTRGQLPLDFQDETSLFRRLPFAGLATRLDTASPDGHSFNFFSILPLSTPTNLPMHVMASFKLSSDRRQIRLDNYKGLETGYNTWLLKELIPPLYLFFLEHLLLSGDVHYRLRWPTDKGDTVSKHIVESFYSRKHLSSSPRRLLPSLYSPPLLLSPQEAVLQHSEHGSIRPITDRLKPERVVDLPSAPKELAERAGVPVIDPIFIKAEILRNPEAITSDIDFQVIHNLIHYLTHKRDTPDILYGLKILPLEDGSFGTLDSRRVGTPYYLWKPSVTTRTHNFSESCFVHPKLRTKELEKLNLNVLRLDVSVVKDLIKAKLSTFPKPIISPAQLQWTDSFWDSWNEYSSSRLGLVPDDVASFPLVPILPSSLVSLEQCKNGDVLLVECDDQESRVLRTCLQKLGLPVVDLDGQIPEDLRQILKQDAYSRLNLPAVLSAISRTELPISNLFSSLDDNHKDAFASWARANVTQISEDQILLAQSLPIWWSAGGGIPRALRPGSEVELLPEKLTLQVSADFMANCVADDAALTHLNKKHMTLDKLPRRLLLPTDMNIPTLLNYKNFYDTWIKHLPLSCNHPLKVPTAARTFELPQDLFKRGPLFMAVFPEHSPFFVHSEFQEFEELLCLRFGLKTEENLDASMFTACAESLDLDGPNALSRAREVFHAYSNILPNRIEEGDLDAWHELDDIAFIPRRMEFSRRLPSQGENDSGLNIPMAVTQLPLILSPAEFVREEFEAIAWSQRACFEVQPSHRVCREYPDLGRPSFSIVLAHLRYLSEQSSLRIRDSQHQILLHDLEKVYGFLNDHLDLQFRQNEELAQSILFALRDEQLFLNIDGPSDRLNWVQGTSLAFDCNDREGSVQDVRKFLSPFEKILLSAGAIRVQHPAYKPEHDALQSESGKLQNIWSSFNQLRKEKVLTDVELIAQDMSNFAEPLLAHRVILAASSQYFKDYFSGDFQEARDASPGNPLRVPVRCSYQCVRSFLDYVYTGSKGEELSLDLLLEILVLSNYYHAINLFDEVQREIITRRLLRPDTVDKIKAVAEVQQATSLLVACTQYESENFEFIRRSIRISTVS